MKQINRLLLVLMVVLILISGAVTVYAVGSEASEEPAAARQELTVAGDGAAADYAAEELAVCAYYGG